MRNLIVMLIVCISLAITSSCCDEYNNQKGSTIFVNLDSAKGFVSNNEISFIDNNECEVFQLNCSTGIGTIEDIKFCKDKMAILDNGRQRIHIIDKNGNCIHEIYHLGKSSKEYIEITDYFLTEDYVYVNDQSSEKILEYNYLGECKNIIDVAEYWANSFFVLDNHIFLINNASDTENGKFHVFEIEKDSKMVKCHIPFDLEPKLCSDNNWSFFYKDSVFYSQKETNTIYKVSKGQCTPYISLDFGEYNLPYELQNKDARELIMNHKNAFEKYVLGIEKVQSTANYLFINFVASNNKYLLVINHHNNKVVSLCRGITIDNMCHIGLMNYYIYDGCIYDVYDSDEFVDIVNNVLSDNDSIDDLYVSKLKNIIGNVTDETPNPIMVKYKIKYEK